MTEEEVFDLLENGYVHKCDHRGQNAKEKAWQVSIGDSEGDLANCYGSTPEIAWDNAVAEMLESLEERKRENSEANDPTLSAYERNL
jgi:hypothetical protein